MASSLGNGKFIIAAGEVGIYSVCPESWRLKYIAKFAGSKDTDSIKLGHQLHANWIAQYEELFSIRNALRVVVALSCTAIVTWLIIRSPRESLSQLLKSGFSANLFDLLFLLIAAGFVATVVVRALRAKSAEGGLGDLAKTVGVDGSTMLPGREYISKASGLAGKPDALLVEDGFLIPVERKPLAKKLRDRYVAQLLVYLRLIEEFEGRRPPHGYLVLGPNCRRVKIENTESRRRWLDQMLGEMNEILKGAPAKPEPHTKKCERCDVRAGCREFVSIGRVENVQVAQAG